ncbi:unnamed protein product [Polarella glacialis]|uniref:Protein C10 n=1 Tax=Polarella glacialis TaxID=89957 RepID=A0A813K5P7_POLGL|nr:unnamed protein product [Polarella glacialis]
MPPCKLTLEQGLELMDTLIAEFSKMEFQERLHKDWGDAGSDPITQGLARQAVCLPLQIPVISKFGFEASKRGVLQSTAAFKPFALHPEVKSRSDLLQTLVSPALQQLVASAQSLQKVREDAAWDPALQEVLQTEQKLCFA